MKSVTQNLLAFAVATSCILSSTVAQSSDDDDDHNYHQVDTFIGHAVTGGNRLRGQPIQDFGPPLNTFGFYNMGVFNPDGSNNPFLIDENTPDDAVLATSVDPFFLTAAGLPLSLIDESLNNLKLADVAANISVADTASIALPSTLDVDPLQPSQVPMKETTLKDWLSAKGKARFKCGDDKNSVSIKVKNLLPNRLYTVWGLFESAEGKFKPAALGGVPNSISTDSKGRGSFKRELGFCAFENTQSGAKLIALDIIYHSDHQAYAAVPSHVAKSDITGTVTHSHLWFIISGESLLDD
ncbi:MAG: hypothetical protein ACI8WB_001994 [Phenylobacterium sp.]|jgi:hypothetical protein